MATLAETRKLTGGGAEYGPGGAQSAYDAPPAQKPTVQLPPAPRPTGSPYTGWVRPQTAGGAPSVGTDPMFGRYKRLYESGISPREAKVMAPSGTRDVTVSALPQYRQWEMGMQRQAAAGAGPSVTFPKRGRITYGPQPATVRPGAARPGTAAGAGGTAGRGGMFAMGQRQTTTYEAPGPQPEFEEAPKFAAPEYQKGRVRKLRQRAAAPRLRELRRALQVALTRQYANPNLRRMALRDALSGYGIGVESVMAGAQQEAAGTYAQEYAAMQQEAQINYQEQSRARMQRYSDAMAAWQKGFKPVVTTETLYGTQTGASTIRPVTKV